MIFENFSTELKRACFIAFYFFMFQTYGQVELFIPQSNNVPLFNFKDETQFGINANNYGCNYQIATQKENRIGMLNFQYNSGHFHFDPLNFEDYYLLKKEQFIQLMPSETFYSEFGYGYNFSYNSKKIALLAGVGHEFKKSNTRYFIQLNWGKESRLLNAGIALRANYTTIAHEDLIILEPALQGKIKLGKLKLLHQFSYSIPLKQDSYMMPVVSFGLEYAIPESLKSIFSSLK